MATKKENLISITLELQYSFEIFWVLCWLSNWINYLHELNQFNEDSDSRMLAFFF